MSESQPEAKRAEPVSSEPKLCKNNCGFFGSNATGDCCSKCWALIKPKDGSTADKSEEDGGKSTDTTKTEADTADDARPENHQEKDVSGVEATAPSAASKGGNGKTATSAIASDKKEESTSVVEAPSPAKKKKKKKTTYKGLMAGMLEGKSSSRDVEKEKEKLKEVTGGGHFQKIDKI